MVSPMEQQQDEDIDLEEYVKEQNAASKATDIDMEEERKKYQEGPDWMDQTLDILSQGALGAAKFFTWPADVVRLMVIGEGLSDIDDLERVYEKEGKPFDRQKYVEAVMDAAQFSPTQDTLEQGFESLTGISLEPKTQSQKVARQIGGLLAFNPGGIAQRTAGAALGAGSTQVLKDVGVGEEKAEVAGDILGFTPGSVLEKGARKFPASVAQHEQTATKHALPFLEYMAKENEPRVRGKLLESTQRTLKNELDLSTENALKKIVKNELPLKRLQERGVNLDALGAHAYDQTRRLAQANPTPLKTDQIVKNIDSEIARLKSLSPSPSDSQKAALKLLEDERDILKIAKPTPEQLINQHMNYNADMKAIYRKPEFSGKEEQVRKTYEFLKNQLVEAMEKQGNAPTANAFNAANKIYSEKMKLDQTESLLRKAFEDGYNPKKLNKLLNSKQGNFLKRNMSPQAVQDIKEIADYGKMAQENLKRFISLDNNIYLHNLKIWGPLAPLVLYYFDEKLAGGSLLFNIARYASGKLLTRPATRQAYKRTLKHASEGSYNLLKNDFHKLENVIDQEYGDTETFVDSLLPELELD